MIESKNKNLPGRKKLEKILISDTLRKTIEQKFGKTITFFQVLSKRSGRVLAKFSDGFEAILEVGYAFYKKCYGIEIPIKAPRGPSRLVYISARL